MGPLIVYSEDDIAGKNIANHLISAFGFEPVREGEWKKGSISLVRLNELHIYSEMNVDAEYDYIIVASRHKSESATPSLTAHVPGNWGNADFGGAPKTLNMAYASKLKSLLREIKKSAEKRNITWTICLEVDHHGPTIAKPILYAEVGSSEAQWRDENACAAVAEAIMAAISDKTEYDSCFGAGGNHYAPAFTCIMFGSERRAVGHILPKFKIDEIGFEMFEQAVRKNVEPLTCVLLDWKGMTAPQRGKVVSFCERAGVKWEKV